MIKYRPIPLEKFILTVRTTPQTYVRKYGDTTITISGVYYDWDDLDLPDIVLTFLQYGNWSYKKFIDMKLSEIFWGMVSGPVFRGMLAGPPLKMLSTLLMTGVDLSSNAYVVEIMALVVASVTVASKCESNDNSMRFKPVQLHLIAFNELMLEPVPSAPAADLFEK